MAIQKSIVGATSSDRPRILLQGDFGTGKTRTGLSFPGTFCIDTEGRAHEYAGAMPFQWDPCEEPDKVLTLIQNLGRQIGDYAGHKTLFLDNYTRLHAAHMEWWNEQFLRERGASKHHHGTYYELQPLDYGIMYRAFDRILRMMVHLDMNVVVSVHEKPVYSGGDMQIIGQTFDGYKRLPGYFGYHLRMIKSDDPAGKAPSKYFITALKNVAERIAVAPGEWIELEGPGAAYKLIEDAFGPDVLGRTAQPANPIAMATPGDHAGKLKPASVVSAIKPMEFDSARSAGVIPLRWSNERIIPEHEATWATAIMDNQLGERVRSKLNDAVDLVPVTQPEEYMSWSKKISDDGIDLAKAKTVLMVWDHVSQKEEKKAE